MKVLVIGGGGREHAIVWKVKESSYVDEIYCAPGNGGISELATCIDIKATDIQGIVQFASKNNIDLTIVAPDDPLAMGLVDALEERGLKAFGPKKDAALIESSKVFAKELMRKYSIPTAEYEVFDDSQKALAYLESCIYPIVIKAEGLALGKGVIIAQNKIEAINAVQDIMIKKKFGDAGRRIIFEDFLQGPEVSVLTFTDGKTIIPMVSSQDHKRIWDHDQGPNTGGMGAFSPSLKYTDDIAEFVQLNILEPTIKGMAKENRVFKGVLYFGLMLTQNGPKVLEYNARFGDPETQVVLPRLKTDLIEIMDAIINERLHEIQIEWEDNASVCVVMSSGGYPGEYKTGYEIYGLDALKIDKGTIVFHAGTKKAEEKFITAGGRVLGITSLGNNLNEAISKAYDSVDKVSFQNAYYRKDIGKK